MKFIPVTVSDYAILKPFFSRNPYNLSVYSPATIIAWSSKKTKAFYALKGDELFIAGEIEDSHDHRHLILPLSPLAYTPSMLHRVARDEGFDRYWYVPGDYLETLDQAELDSFFTVVEQKEFEDYVYLTEDLAYLKGNRFSKKRNLINQFSREYLLKDRVKVQEILPGRVEECLEFLEIWCEKHDCEADQESVLACEKNAVIVTLENIEQIGSKGIQIRIDGKVAAFGIGSRLNETTGTLNFEKADSEIKGLYQFLDNECAKRLFDGYLYINKESDMGLASLAESKQSYNPVLRVKSYSLILR